MQSFSERQTLVYALVALFNLNHGRASSVWYLMSHKRLMPFASSMRILN